MILHFKDPKNSTPKLLETINLQKSLAVLNTYNEQTEKEYMEKFHLQ
jgi:hypothetical protein